MEVNMNIFSKAMRVIASAMQYPVIILLILLIGVSIFMIGWIISEYCTERKHLSVVLPQMIDEFNATSSTEELVEVINNGGLLQRQKTALTELTAHPEITPLMRESLAVRMVEQEQAFYDRRTKITDFIAKVAPMLGLLGTLIPLGPGIIALGQGDTITLSSSLLTAFDTTILGLISATVAMLISTIRGRWYRNYMSIIETLMECILEVEKKHVEA